jgi:hypothetical protein
MGTFHVSCTIQNMVKRGKRAVVPKMLVDTGSEYTWVSEELLDKLGIQREKRILCL